MLSYRTQIKLAQLIQGMAEGERKNEVVRQVLAEQRLFEPYTAFKRLDRMRNGFATSTDLERFLFDNDIVLNHRELHYVFKQFDVNSTGRITYSNFMKNVLPKEDLALSELASSRKSYPIAADEYLPYEIEWALARVFEQSAKNFRAYEGLRESLAQSYDFNERNSFNTIDQIRKGWFNINDLDKFLRSINFMLSEEELDAFFRIVDLDEDGRITYGEFIESVIPSEFYARSFIQKKNYKPLRSFSQEKIYRAQYRDEVDTDSYYQQAQKLSNKNSLSRNYNLSRSYYSPCRTRLNLKCKCSPYRKIASPTRKIASPTRKIASPLRKIASPYKYQSPTRKIASPYKYRSPPRKIASPYKSFSNSLNYRTPLRFTPSRYRPSYYSNIKESPMKGNEERHLARALKEQIDVGRDQEELKQQLALRSDFNLLDGFRLFDFKGKGYLTSNELRQALEELGVFASHDEIYLFFRRFNCDYNGLFKYSDFCKFIQPQNQNYAQLMNERTPLYNDNQNDNFSFETKRILRKLFSQALNGETENESLRQRLAKRPLFSIQEAFEALDKNKSGYITIDEFKQILQDHGYFTSKSDLIGLIKQYDKNRDGRVSYYEFVNEICPKSPKKY